MNIVLLPSPPFEEIGGVSTHVYMLANALRELGHNVEIIPDRPPKIYRALFVALPVRVINIFSVYYARKYVYYTNAFFYMVNAIIKAKFGSIDIINFQNVQHISIAYWLKKLTGCKTVLTVHGFLTYEAEAGNWCLPGDEMYKWLWKLETTGYDKFNSIIGVSKKIATYINKFTSKKITVIYNGLNTDIYIPLKKKSANGVRLLFAGVLESHKGVRDALEAVNILVHNNKKKVTLFIAGSGYEENYVKEYIDNNRLANHVKFFGSLDKRKMPDFYASGDIFICPSKTRGISGQGEEPFGYTALEAMSCGLPVVAYNTGGLKEQIVHGETGFLVEQGNIKELVDKITALIDSEDLRNEMSQKARKRVIDHFSHQAMAQQFLNVYKAEVV